MPSAGIDWPGGARCAVMLTFDVDGPAVWIDDHPEVWHRPRVFSLGAYGPRRGVPRILDLLDEHGVPATFFVPGWVAETWPDCFRQIIEAGHEVGHHGYMHELYINKPLAEMESIIERSQAVFERLGGHRAVGFRTPSGDFQAGSHEVLRRLGFLYSSSMRGDDRPYRWVFSGRVSDLVEIPAHWEMDDFPQFGYNDSPPDPASRDRIGGLEWTYDNWRREFDGYYREGLCFPVIMHPQLMGKPGRVELLRRLIEYIQGHRGVWFGTGEQIASWWRERY
jgi:peptidoglycan-N-acetylglucosamine deacetylase